ncbi:MAG: amino acid permease [Negativicutes bacterium]|jgi:APA family basic amino acid/polyamine antiporter
MKKIDADSGLKRDIGFLPALAIVVGTIIGAGVFMKPAVVLSYAGGSGEALTAWVIGGILVLTGGLTVAELGAMIPKTGGVYAYLEEVYGETTAYMFGWMRTVVFAPATLAALGLYFASIFTQTFGYSQGWIIPIAFISLITLMLINISGAKYSGYFQTVATAVKLLPIIALAVAGLIFGENQIIEPTVVPGAPTFAGMGLAVIACLFAYDGFTNVAVVAGELRNPAKIIPKATIVGVSTVIVAYLCVNVAIFHTLSDQSILQLGKATSATVAQHLFGSIGGHLLNIGIMISIFGCMNGYLLTLARVPYAMACRNQLPASGWFRKINAKFGTPVNSIVFIIVFSFVELVLDADWLTNFSILSLWLFYILTYAGLFILRRRDPDKLRPYKVPLYPYVPAVALLGGIFVFVSTFVGDPVMSLASCGLTVVGLPVLWLVRKYGNK